MWIGLWILYFPVARALTAKILYDRKRISWQIVWRDAVLYHSAELPRLVDISFSKPWSHFYLSLCLTSYPRGCLRICLMPSRKHSLRAFSFSYITFCDTWIKYFRQRSYTHPPFIPLFSDYPPTFEFLFRRSGWKLAFSTPNALSTTPYFLWTFRKVFGKNYPVQFILSL